MLIIKLFSVLASLFAGNYAGYWLGKVACPISTITAMPRTACPSEFSPRSKPLRTLGAALPRKQQGKSAGNGEDTKLLFLLPDAYKRTTQYAVACTPEVAQRHLLPAPKPLGLISSTRAAWMQPFAEAPAPGAIGLPIRFPNPARGSCAGPPDGQCPGRCGEHGRAGATGAANRINSFYGCARLPFDRFRERTHPLLIL